MDRFTKRILDHLVTQSTPARRIRDLAKELGVPAHQQDDFSRSVEQLVTEGQVVLSSPDTIALPPPGREMIGTFRLSARGFGFLVPDVHTAHGDLFVPEGQTAGALTGDKVKARVIHQQSRGRQPGRSPYTGVIIQILARADRRYVGNLLHQNGQWQVIVDGKSLPHPVVVRDPGAKNAKLGDKVVVEIISYPQEDQPAEGVITQVLGDAGEPDVETQAIIHAYALPLDFPSQVVDDARAVNAQFDPSSIPPGRQDLTGQFIITIDPPDARDYDDAIGIQRFDSPQPDGASWELGVHIADVAHFVRPDSPLDKEAYIRGNSTYLPRRVIPMLPEILSNGVCSLQEGVLRYCKSAFIRYDDQGVVVGQRFGRTAIRSAKRLTYLEAQALIDGDLRQAIKHTRSEPKYPRPLIPALQLMDQLAKQIRQRRLREGMIVLGLPEVELVYDDTGRVIDAVPEDDAFTHTLIEMFMVEANEAVARLFDALDIPIIRRIHPDPPSTHMGELRQFARVAGYNIPQRPTKFELQQLLDAVRGKPAQHAVHLAVLQTLSRAEYAPLLIGHFALASEHYAHFTSPIRRYPDLTLHRALDAYFDAYPEHPQRWLPARGKDAILRLTQTLRRDPRCPDQKALVAVADHCSSTERNAESAEKELRTFLVMQLLAEHLGDEFAGTVTGLTGSGMFVQLDKYLVDGFVRLEDVSRGFGGEIFRLNRSNGTLVGQRSGRGVAIGDRFTVRIAKVWPEKRQLDLIILPPAKTPHAPSTGKPHKPADKGKRRQPAGARAAHQQTAKIKTQKNHRKGKRRR
ncbi:MAG: VacB/RNase II family 3'-5' exoribonuclease [Phycisphaeraceae bacterium]|nr:VacB/RNase II family 3'-5' exoribonuclease [Phycisphaeraceae bacterium]